MPAAPEFAAPLVHKPLEQLATEVNAVLKNAGGEFLQQLMQLGATKTFAQKPCFVVMQMAVNLPPRLRTL